jgi:hypothetical protein
MSKENVHEQTIALATVQRAKIPSNNEIDTVSVFS